LFEHVTVSEGNVYLFICSIFNDAVNNSDYIDLKMIVNTKLEGIYKGAILAEFNVLSLNLSARTVGNHEIPQESLCSNRDLKRATLAYESIASPLEPTR
jgi:hypothetical protein